MATLAPEKVWTWKDLVEMPDDGVERWIIKGQLREKQPEFEGVTMTVRNRFHSKTMTMIAAAILTWSRRQPKPRGDVLCGEAGVILPGTPTDTVGLDVVYVGPSTCGGPIDKSSMYKGVPILCVEILSPNDTTELVDEKIETYLKAGVPIVWVANPYRFTITVYTPDAEPQMYSRKESIPEHPAMPGFTPSVAELFEE